MSTKFCQTCGTQCNETDNVCPKCGYVFNQPQMVINTNITQNTKPQNGFGIAGMILGIIAVCLVCIAIGGFIGLIGLILSIVGMTTKTGKKGPAIAGICLNSIAVAITVLAIMVAALGNQSTTDKEIQTAPATSKETTTLPTESSSDDTKSVFGINETVTLNDWTITVTKVETTNRIQENEYFYLSPDEGNQYLVLDITVTNNGTNADTFIPTFGFGNDISAKLYYQEDYEYTSTNLLGYSYDLHDSTLNPLATKSGILAFEIPDSIANSTDELIFKISAGRDYIDFKVR